MNKKIFLYFILVFGSLFFFVINSEACLRPGFSCNIGDFIVVPTGGTLGNGMQEYAKQVSGDRVFCIEKGSQAPAIGSNGDSNPYYCDFDYTGTEKWRAAVGYMINLYNAGTINYKTAQVVIHQISSEAGSGESNELYDDDGYIDYYNAAHSIYQNYNTEALSFDTNSLSFSLVEDEYVSNEITVSSTNLVPAFSLKIGETQYNDYIYTTGDKIQIKIPTSIITSPSTVSLSATGSNLYKLATFKSCKKNDGTLPKNKELQEVALTSLTDKSISKTVTVSGNIYLNYTITYDANGGTGAPDQQTKEHDVPIYLSDQKPTKTGSTFTSWNTKRDGSGTVHPPNGYYGTNADLYLYAQWKPIVYEIIYHGNGGYAAGNKIQVSDTTEYYNWYSVKDENTFSRPQHKFLGWTTNSDGITDDGYNWTGWSGYWIWTNGQYGVSDNKLHLYARWQDSCIYDFINKYNNNPSTLDRLNMFKEYGKYSGTKNRRNLLNFTFTNAEDACGDYTPEYGKTESCLEVDQVNNSTTNKFTHQNLSDFNDTILASIATDKSYCLTDFEFSKTTDVYYNKDAIIKAGQMVLSLNEGKKLATGVLKKTCYIHKDVYNKYISNITKENFIDTNYYISESKLDGITLQSTSLKSDVTSTLNGDFYKIYGTVTISYQPNAVYANKLTGLTSDKSQCIDHVTQKLKNNCTILGYGVASKFVDAKNSSELSFDFSIGNNSRSDNPISFNGNNSCPYKVSAEIIKYPTPNGKLDIEFRTIDTTVPFNRTTKTNWCGTDCSKDNNIVQENIKNKNNSYNITGGGAIYTITLTPYDLQLIKDYNKNTKYDVYKATEIEISGNKVIVNSFVNELKKGNLEGYGTLSNKLITK